MMADTAIAAFEANRDRLLGIAYRITGTWSDSEDVVQETWLRWNSANKPAIANSPGWLTTVCSRIAIDRLRSTQRQREVYVGPWLPEPIATGQTPEDQVEQAESLKFGFLVALEQLSPIDRAVFVLRDVFGLRFSEIAPVVDKSEQACRQIATRARTRIRNDRPSLYDNAESELGPLLDACVSAAAAGELGHLERLFTGDVKLVSDGGPNRHAARRPVVGADRVARFLVGIAKRRPPAIGATRVEANASPSILISDDAVPYLLLTAELDHRSGLIRRIWAVVNPDKLQRLHMATQA